MILQRGRSTQYRPFASLLIEAEAAAVGQTIAVGQVTQTDLAQAVTWAPKHRLVGHATEAPASGPTAQPITARKTLAVGQVVETGLAQAVAWAPKRRLVGQTVETDLSQAIAWAPKSRLVAQAVETDLAQGVTRALVVAVGQALEADLAQAVAWAPKRRLVAQALETDLAQTVAWAPKRRLVTQAVETDLTQALARVKTKLLGAVAEVNLAQPGGRRKTQAVAQAVEVDTAQALTSLKTRVVSQALELNLAQVLTRRKAAGIAQSAEADLASAIAWAPKRRLIGQSFETDAAQPIAVTPRVIFRAKAQVAVFASVADRQGHLSGSGVRRAGRVASLHAAGDDAGLHGPRPGEMMAIQGSLEKQPNETFPVGIDFVRRLGTGETIVAGPTVTSRNAATGADTSATFLSATAALVAGSKVTKIVLAGADGDTHIVTFRIVTSAGNTFEEELSVRVRET